MEASNKKIISKTLIIINDPYFNDFVLLTLL